MCTEAEMFERRNGIPVLFIMVLALILAACTATSPYPPDVEEALVAAGDNSSELKAVLSHYASSDDTLKLQAAQYLIGNMEGHCFATYVLQDTAGNEVEFDVLDYPDFDALRAAIDSLEEQLGELDFERGEKNEDLDVVTSDFLIGQIDYAFRAWREKPWAKGLSFNAVLEYILPYRGSNEPLEPWRETFWKMYGDIDENMADPSDPIEAATLINDDIKTWFTFDPRFYYHPTDQGLSEMRSNGLGRCEDMTNVTIYAMRANGLAVTSDYTPHWANSGGNHAWNAVVSPDGTVIPFMGAESSPGNYSLANLLAKVYRKMYSKQKDNLTFQNRKQEAVPGWLAGKSYRDVTADYADVCDVSIAFTREIPDSVDIAYLCVFNSGEWRAIHWGRIENGEAVFTDMGAGIAYLPALYLNGDIFPFGSPFILGQDCGLRELRAEDGNNTSAELISTTRRKQEISTDGIAETFLTPGHEYELSCWQDGWRPLGKAVASDKALVFEDVPAGCLYWLTEEDSDREERIFTVDDGVQVWW
jgi:hypothetical protein